MPKFLKTGFWFMLEILVLCCIVFSAMIPVMIYKKLQTRLIVMRFLDMVGWAVPPTFPIFFNICYSFTLYRLKKDKIFATDPTKTCTAGKVKSVFFDKTGTLTLNTIEMTRVVLFNQAEEGKEATTEEISTKDQPMNPS